MQTNFKSNEIYKIRVKALSELQNGTKNEIFNNNTIELFQKKKGRRIKPISDEKIVIKRKLTKSTNLKTFPAKDQPENQTKIDNFFKPTTISNKVSYFKTFSQSKSTIGIKDCINDYLEVAKEELKRKQIIERQTHLISEVINLVSDEEMEECSERVKNTPPVQERIQESSNIGEYCSHRKRKQGTKCHARRTRTKISEVLENLSTNDNKSNDAKDNESSEIINSRLSEETAGSIDYTPLKIRKEIENIRKTLINKSATSLNSEFIDQKNETSKSKEKILTFQYNQNPQKIVIDCINCDLSNVKSKVNCSSKSRKNSSSKSQTTRSSKNTSLPHNHTEDTSSESVIACAKIDLTVDVTSCDIKKVYKTSVKCKGKSSTVIKKPTRIVKCPDYKIIESTSFAVDAFRFGDIEGVTHYFLTHFHADHYIGLKKSFQKPIYLSEITGRLVEAFIKTNRKYLNVMKLNEPIMINDIEVTALDANHCPGAVMFLFKFSNGMCTLHTGDFRASPEMEIGPTFWNNTIHTIYLDTTYLSSKYDFMTQSESIEEILNTIDDFNEKHIGQRILYICGSYVIGKEKLWLEVAKRFGLKVWTDGNRRKALEIINDQQIIDVLVDDPTMANLHVITLGQVSYDYLSRYLNKFSDYFDVLFAIRPSGWEKNSKPQYRGRINIKGIEYSEHSSYNELQRFVRFLQPKKLISTVPSSNNLSKTNKIPNSWLNNSIKSRRKGYQQSITNFINNVNQNPGNPNISVVVSENESTNRNIHSQTLMENLNNPENWFILHWFDKSPEMEKGK